MPIEIGPTSDLRLEELRSVLATIIGRPAEDIEDWLIIVKLPCGNCGHPYCGDGPIATMHSRAGVDDNGNHCDQPPFILHLTSMLTASLAEQWYQERK